MNIPAVAEEATMTSPGSIPMDSALLPGNTCITIYDIYYRVYIVQYIYKMMESNSYRNSE